MSAHITGNYYDVIAKLELYPVFVYMHTHQVMYKLCMFIIKLSKWSVSYKCPNFSQGIGFNADTIGLLYFRGKLLYVCEYKEGYSRMKMIECNVSIKFKLIFPHLLRIWNSTKSLSVRIWDFTASGFFLELYIEHLL